MPLSGTESALGDALYNAATAAEGDARLAWLKVAAAIIKHISQNSIVTGTCPPNGGPLTLGKVT